MNLNVNLNSNSNIPLSSVLKKIQITANTPFEKSNPIFPVIVLNKKYIGGIEVLNKIKN